ncbi:unnamed protein product [Peronospora belbahrii]|uniref:Uncharacterized protein n=1 Tax=Peronospora belbahrii TaxID=622444 RepID=A0ABN8CRQ4_9STRA|nr:unnamed protein product [Peronospora belbahrii]
MHMRVRHAFHCKKIGKHNCDLGMCDKRKKRRSNRPLNFSNHAVVSKARVNMLNKYFSYEYRLMGSHISVEQLIKVHRLELFESS